MGWAEQLLEKNSSRRLRDGEFVEYPDNQDCKYTVHD